MIRLPALAALLSFAGVHAAIAQNLERFLDEETLEFAEEYDKRLRNAPPTVEIISREDLNRRGAVTLTEALEHVLGIHVRAQPDGRQREHQKAGAASLPALKAGYARGGHGDTDPTRQAPCPPRCPQGGQTDRRARDLGPRLAEDPAVP